MEGDIKILRKKIELAKKNTAAKIDSMNQLAVLLFENNGADANEISQEAIREAKSIGYEEGEAQALVHAGMYASSQRNYTEAIEYYTRAISIRHKVNDEEGLANVYSKLGNTFLYDGRYVDALSYYAEAITLRKKLKDELSVADLHTNSAIIYGLQGNYMLAIQNHLLAKEIYDRLSETSRIAGSCSNIGLIYIEQKNFDEALKMFQEALVIREKTNDPKLISVQLNNIGYVYQEQNKLPEALDYHLRALKLREEIGDKQKTATTYANLGNVYKAKGDLSIAHDYYDRSLSLFQELNDKRGLVQAFANLGELFFETGKWDEAQAYLKKSIHIAEELGLKNQLRRALEWSSKIYAREGEFEKAFETQSRFILIDKEISNTETSVQIAQMTARYEIEKREREAEIERIKHAELTKAYTELESAKRRSEELLLNILPEEVSEELKKFGKTKARSYQSVTVLFADIKGFTKISEQLTAEEIVDGIDEYFEAFDKLMDKYGVEKIKTIGDAYLCVCGVPVPDNDHAVKTIQVALDFVETVQQLKLKREAEKKRSFDFRIGIHSGPIVAGVVGIKKFAYDIWGDTVNTASRMQSNGEPNRINISEATYQLVKNKFNCEYRGEIEAKNKGKQKMYFVTG